MIDPQEFPRNFTMPSRADIFREYEDERRRRLSNIVVPAFAALDSLAVVVFGSYIVLLSLGGKAGTADFWSSVESWSLIALLDVFFGTAFIAARRGRLNLATNLTVIATTIAIMSIETVWVVAHGLDPYGLNIMASFGIAIVLAGVLSGPRAVIVTATAFSLFSLALLFLADRPWGDFNRELLLITSGSLIYQWAFAGLLIGILAGYRRALQDLGESRFAVERAERLDELKNQFISSVNHELRNPLGAMLGFLEILNISLERASPQQIRALVGDATQSGEDMRDLISSILETRLVDQGATNFTPAPVPVRAALVTAIHMLDPREVKATERDVQVRVAPDLFAWGDRVRLQQVLVNLLSNALKYSAPGTPIEVRADVVPVGKTLMVDITVRDYGLGVPPEQATLLFTRFVRLPRDLASTTIGNGLGLYLCRIFTEAMGGTIWVESSGVRGAGSAFHVRLSLATAPLTEEHPPATPLGTDA